MPETDLTIRGYSGTNKLRIEPTEISGEGGPAYPRLIVPGRLALNPVRDSQGKELRFFILDLRAALFLGNEQSKIADALASLDPHRVYHSNVSTTGSLEFPLDAFRIGKIEEKRKGDLTIRLGIRFTYGLYESLGRADDSKTVEKQYLADIESNFAELRLEIPQSHWVQKIMPALGYFEYFLIEIPKGGEIIREAWSYLENAEAAFTRWDTKAVFANCREAGVLLDQTVKAKFGDSKFSYSERWGRAYREFNHFASLDLHIEDIKKSPKYPQDEVKVSKSDAEHLILVTKSLIKYAGQLLQEGQG